MTGDRRVVLTASDLRGFHDELRARNVPILAWAVGVFGVLYLGWCGFDYVFAQSHWQRFLAYRAVAVLICSLLATAVHHHRLRHRSWEAVWLTAFSFGGFIAPMLPYTGDNFYAYVMGFSVVIIGAGLLPYWPTAWGATCVLATVAVGMFAVGRGFLDGSSNVDSNSILGSAFFIATATGLSIAACYFKYDVTRRDYRTRMELAALARREADALIRLDGTKTDLQNALDKLKELDRLKSKFFANVSHELRTPLTLVLAPLEELIISCTDSEQERQLNVIHRNAHRLLRLIDDLLDLSRLDAGGLRLNVAEVDVRAIAHIVHENSLPAALARSISFTLRAEASSKRILGDAHRLEIVLTNLVGNALKFTPPGGRIELSVEDRENGVRLAVSDTGSGIPAEALPHVFERFFQAVPADRRREGGVGIGLALAKELVELHGGSIAVESELERGTTFTVFLPFGGDRIRPEAIERRRHFRLPEGAERRVEVLGPAPAAGETPRPYRSASPPAARPLLHDERRARILLAEDHDEMREFIRNLLEPEYTLFIAADGNEAWDVAQREHPDLVISDVMMPGRSGTALCHAIKADAGLQATPVILLTAQAGSEATLEGYAYGADDFVTKPFHPRVLLARVRAHLKLRALTLDLTQREKLAAIGTLAAGVLHEVRNPVNAILNAARVLADGKASAAMSQRLIGIVGDAAQRIQAITAALDAHARPAEGGAVSPCDVREGLDATLRLLEHKMSEVEVHREYTTERAVRAPAGPLNQVFLNLLDNAVRAGAHNVWLSVAEREQDITVTIGDDGPGVPPELATLIFDPFFTTRQAGEGTGLGLYLSRQIVERHGGALWLEDRPGGGAQFVVKLHAAAV
jgi:signal transduction histidine kinase